MVCGLALAAAVVVAVPAWGFEPFAACPVDQGKPYPPPACSPDGPACDDGDRCTEDRCEPCESASPYPCGSYECFFDNFNWGNRAEIKPYHECRLAQAAAFLAAIEQGSVDVQQTRRDLLRKLSRRVAALQRVAATTTPGTRRQFRRFRAASFRVKTVLWPLQFDEVPNTAAGLGSCLADLIPLHPGPSGCSEGPCG